MEYIQNTTKAFREIWRGSGNINILLISALTLAFYIGFLILFNNDVFTFLTRIKGVEDFNTTKDYLKVLEALNLNTLNVLLIPLIIVSIFLAGPTNVINKNMLSRLLPISPKVRVTAFILSICAIASVSLSVVHILNWSISSIMRVIYLTDTIALQESFGQLYKVLNSNMLLSLDYQYVNVIPISFVVVLISSVLLTLFRNIVSTFSLANWMHILIVPIFIVAPFYVIKSSSPDTNMIDLDPNNYMPIVYGLMLSICLGSSWYYFLKNREG